MGVGVLICLERGADCQVVQKKRPLSGCSIAVVPTVVHAAVNKISTDIAHCAVCLQ